MSIEVGQRFPDFELPDQDRKARSLKEFSGRKVVVAFFPGAFTGVCTKEMCTFRDSMQTLQAVQTNLIGISVNDPFTNKAFAEANKLQFPILSDYTRDVIKRLNIYHENFAGLKQYTASKRAVFILDGQGIVRYKWISEDPTKEPNYAEINQTLSKL